VLRIHNFYFIFGIGSGSGLKRVSYLDPVSDPNSKPDSHPDSNPGFKSGARSWITIWTRNRPKLVFLKQNERYGSFVRIRPSLFLVFFTGLFAVLRILIRDQDSGSRDRWLFDPRIQDPG
jgi:hypothetical protein